jgi:HD-GYP domain-containing protein (c-di-GMP phosphodiesterase class II)
MTTPDHGRGRLTATEEILKAFSSAVRCRSMYPANHPIMALNCRRVVELLQTLRLDEAETWSIVLLGGEFVYEKIPLTKASAQAAPLFRLLQDRRIESLTFRRGVTAEEVSGFINMLLRENEFWDKVDDSSATLSSAGIKNIVFQRVQLQMTSHAQSADTEAARDIYVSMRKILTNFFVSLFNPKTPPALDVVYVVRDRLAQAMEQDRFAAISRLHTRHASDDLVGHAINTAIIAYATAEEMGLPVSLRIEILTAGLLFEVGMMDVPPRVVGGVLRSSQDKRIYLEHAVRGVGILAHVPGAPLLAQIASFEHHRRWDDKGFPTSKHPRKLNLATSILAAGSHYDRLLHGEAAVPPEEIALRMVRLAGVEFDPQVLAHMIVAIGVYPPGSFVQLTTDEAAIVMDCNRNDVFRPIVKLLFDADGKRIEDDQRKDLMSRHPVTGVFLASVRRSIAAKDLPH